MHGIDLINRGYENFMEKLVELGAKVGRARGRARACVAGGPRTPSEHDKGGHPVPGGRPLGAWRVAAEQPLRAAYLPLAASLSLEPAETFTL